MSATGELLRQGSAWLRSRREQSKLSKTSRSGTTFGVPPSEPSTPGAQAPASAWLAAGSSGYHYTPAASSSTATDAPFSSFHEPTPVPREKAPLNDWEVWNEEEVRGAVCDDADSSGDETSARSIEAGVRGRGASLVLMRNCATRREQSRYQPLE